MGISWKYTNKTTCKEIECNDIRYLMYTLKTDEKIPVPEGLTLQLALVGQVNYIIDFPDGTFNNIEIREDKNNKNFADAIVPERVRV